MFQQISATAGPAGRIEGDVKNAVRVGGWSQQRYARRRDRLLLHDAKEVAQVLEDLMRTGSFSRVVLLSSRETMREIEDVLSPQVAAKVAGSKAVDLHAGDHELVDQAYGPYFDEERESEARPWDRIRGEYLGDGPAAAGSDEVLKAALVGRVDSVIVTRDAKLRGTRCRDCENDAAGEPASCPTCGSGSIFAVDLVDDLARQAELTAARVEFTGPIPGLSQPGHIAALLRY